MRRFCTRFVPSCSCIELEAADFVFGGLLQPMAVRTRRISPACGKFSPRNARVIAHSVVGVSSVEKSGACRMMFSLCVYVPVPSECDHSVSQLSSTGTCA
mmetsp:Transcript_63638/g.169617  ORF Transcript_63638/g.169617 Transcript_63638/m.169617 type:complete len:100 (+) Transcript_63638:1230-1529(+)